MMSPKVCKSAIARPLLFFFFFFKATSYITHNAAYQTGNLSDYMQVPLGLKKTLSYFLHIFNLWIYPFNAKSKKVDCNTYLKKLPL